jgi:hypothetical protein
MLSNEAIGLKSECGTWILEAAKGDNWRQIASDKRRHIATNSLPLFVARFRVALFPNDFVRRWCLCANEVSIGLTPTPFSGCYECMATAVAGLVRS